jgi:hypothetical protein
MVIIALPIFFLHSNTCFRQCPCWGFRPGIDILQFYLARRQACWKFRPSYKIPGVTMRMRQHPLPQSPRHRSHRALSRGAWKNRPCTVWLSPAASRPGVKTGLVDPVTRPFRSKCRIPLLAATLAFASTRRALLRVPSGPTTKLGI